MPRDSALLTWCVVASIAAHALALTLLPGLRAPKDDAPQPLLVELVKPPQIIEPPKPLPLVPEPPPKAKAEQPAPKKAEPKRTEQTVAPEPPSRTVLTAPPEVPVSPLAPIVPAPPPVQEARPIAPLAPQAPEAKPTPPPVAPQPVTPPRADAAYLNNPRPNYPLAARRRGDQGTVLVRLIVTAEGLAKSVGLARSSGHAALDDAALAAVASWRFIPAKQGVQAVDAPYEVPVVFKLD